jgi:FPC/CPF motif-containing protein YcgG
LPKNAERFLVPDVYFRASNSNLKVEDDTHWERNAKEKIRTRQKAENAAGKAPLLRLESEYMYEKERYGEHVKYFTHSLDT